MTINYSKVKIDGSACTGAYLNGASVGHVVVDGTQVTWEEAPPPPPPPPAPPPSDVIFRLSGATGGSANPLWGVYGVQLVPSGNNVILRNHWADVGGYVSDVSSAPFVLSAHEEPPFSAGK